MTREEKVKKLLELVPEMTPSSAPSWFPEFRDAEYNDFGSPLRKKIIQAVKDINAGITDSPLYKALS